MTIDQSPEVVKETKEELSDKDVQFIKRFDLPEEALQFKSFAHDDEAIA